MLGYGVYHAIFELLLSKGLAGGTVVRAVAGFTRGKGIVTAKILDLSENLPLKIEVIDAEEAIERVLPDIYLMLDKGLITVEDIEVVKYTGASAAVAAAPPEGPRKVTMKAKELRVHISEKDLYHGEPLYQAILNRFAAEGFAGATVSRAIEGFGARRLIHRDGFLKRDAPLVLAMIDTEERVRRAREIIDGMLEHGVAVVGDVEATFYGPSAEGKAPSGEREAGEKGAPQ